MKWYVNFLVISLLFLQACRNLNLISESTVTQVPTKTATSSPAPSQAPTILTRLPEATGIITSSLNSDAEEVIFRVDGLLENNAAHFNFIEVEKTNEPEWESSVNPTAEYRAFHLCVPPCGIFVEELFSGKTYELSMPDFDANRNFKDLSWSSAYVLEFKQVTSPDIAIGYTIDVEKRQLLDVVHYLTP